MLVVVRADRCALRRWHLRLGERLRERRGVEVAFRIEDQGARLGGLDALMALESLIPGSAAASAADRIKPEALAGFATGADRRAELVIDLAETPLTTKEPVRRVECDGAPLELGLAAALAAGRAPIVRVLGPHGPAAVGRIGVERFAPLGAAYEDLTARVTTLIGAALDGGAIGPLPLLPEAASAPGSPGVAALAYKRAKLHVLRAGHDTLCFSPHWRVGWRRAGSGGRFGDLGGGWRDLPDDGRRFYADPFPIVWRGRTFLFVEEFAHRLGRGILSVVEFGSDGPLGPPTPALVEPGHLSYPNVFERDGEMWMIPETGYSRDIVLYRAVEFPNVWRRERTLVENVVASDATLVQRDGRWWMFATVRDGGGSFSDALWLWSAPDFRGPWKPHDRNPVLVDVASARPAGRMIERGGALWRPVQDCRAGYGAALGWARVETLDDRSFTQTVETILKPGGGWPGRRLHTYNAAGGFEFIDGSAFAPRWTALRRRAQARGERAAAAAYATAPRFPLESLADADLRPGVDCAETRIDA